MTSVRTTISCRLLGLAPAAAIAALGWLPLAVQADPAAPAFPSEVRWSVPLDGPVAAPPVIAGSRVFVAEHPDRVAAYAFEELRQEWTASLAVSGPMTAGDGLLVVPVEGRVHALHAETGSLAWTIESGAISAPLLLRGGWLLIASDDELAAFRASDGKEVWRRRIGPITGRPAIDGPAVYVSIDDGRVAALEIPSGSLLWERPVGASPTEPLAFADRVYVGANGRDFVCLSATTGEQQWSQLIGAAVRGAAAADRSHVYLVSMDNLLRALHRTNGALQWKADLRGRPSGGPVVIGPTVTVPGFVASTLHAFDAATGKQAAELTLPDRMATLPAFAVPDNGQPTAIAAITGNLQDKWSLVLATRNKE